MVVVVVVVVGYGCSLHSIASGVSQISKFGLKTVPNLQNCNLAQSFSQLRYALQLYGYGRKVLFLFELEMHMLSSIPKMGSQLGGVVCVDVGVGVVGVDVGMGVVVKGSSTQNATSGRSHMSNMLLNTFPGGQNSSTAQLFVQFM